MALNEINNERTNIIQKSVPDFFRNGSLVVLV